MMDMEQKKEEKAQRGVQPKFKFYLFVKNDMGMGAGKVAVQVGHACSRIAARTIFDFAFGGRIMVDVYEKYIEDGEYKLVFKVDELPVDVSGVNYHPKGPTDDVQYMRTADHHFYQTFVHDRNMDRFTVMGLLTDMPIDTSGFKLL